MQPITTKDNSITYYNKQYQETYHSRSGAVEEAIKKFVEPAQIKGRKQVKILDICFGLGYNSAATIDAAGPDCKIEIVGLENDSSILGLIPKLNPGFRSYNILKHLNSQNLTVNHNNVCLKLLLGDARKTIQGLNQTFDIVFLDPFSPKKCPELWALEFFKNIAKLCKKGTILTTYSCARSVRNNLEKVGFTVKDGPCVGRRAPSTIAIMN